MHMAMKNTNDAMDMTFTGNASATALLRQSSGLP